MPEYGYCLMNKKHHGGPSGYPLSTAGLFASPLSESDCSILIALFRCTLDIEMFT